MGIGMLRRHHEIVKPAEKPIDYSALKVDELRGLAKERGIEGYSGLKKEELIQALSM